MRLLVTRPEPDASQLAGLARAEGHDILLSPLTHISYVAAPDWPQAAPTAIAFTSANGVRALAATKPPVMTADWTALPAYAVGPQTGEALHQYGWTDIRVGGGNVALLAARIMADEPDEKAHIWHIVGTHQAGHLVSTLSQLGCRASCVRAYEAQAAQSFTAEAQAALVNGEIDAVLVHSQRSAEIFLSLWHALTGNTGDGQIIRPRIFALSPQVTGPFVDRGWQTDVAARPDSQGMTALLRAMAT
ncbi:MAG: uroporphyrinogen-III synthase [Parvibaculales bacterium]